MTRKTVSRIMSEASDLKDRVARQIVVIATDTTNMKETGFGPIDTCMAFHDAIREKYSNVTFRQVSTKAELLLIATKKPDLVVLCSKYLIVKEEQKIWFSEFFSERGITHTGSDRAALEFDSNKSKAKTLLLNAGIATAKSFLALPGQYASEQLLPLPLPLFIKPLDAANSNGIDENSIVHDYDSYERKVDVLFSQYGVTALVEEIIPGKEFTVAIFEDGKTGALSTMVIEIIPSKNSRGDRILGGTEKLNNQEKVTTVAQPMNTAVSEVARAAFTVLGGRDFGRIDVKLNAVGEPYVLEANLVPGMTPDTSYFPRACSITLHVQDKMTYNEVAWKIVELGLNRVNTTTPILRTSVI